MNDQISFHLIIQRLKTVLNVRDEKDVAEALGMSAQAFSRRKIRNSVPKIEIESLCLKKGINSEWVLTGEGPIQMDTPPSGQAFVTNLMYPNFQVGIRTHPREIPVLSYAQCGKWRQINDMSYPSGVADRYEFAPTRDNDAFYVIAAGDSMTGSGINDGDLLLVEPSRDIYDGQIVLVIGINVGCTVKKYFREPEGIRLEPTNPAHEPMYYPDGWAEKEEIKIYRITKKVTEL